MITSNRLSNIQFPTSPIKPNVLQPSLKSGLSNNGGNNYQSMTLMKTNLVQTASADSTKDGEENILIKQTTAVKSKPSSRKTKSSHKSNNSFEQQHPFVKHHHSVKKPQTPSVSRRNARERNRVKQVNNGFYTLRTHIPHLKNKTSKVDTLRAAVDYIQTLRKLLGEDTSYDDEMKNKPILISDSNSDAGGYLPSSHPDSPGHSSSAEDLIHSPAPPQMVYQFPNMSEFVGSHGDGSQLSELLNSDDLESSSNVSPIHTNSQSPMTNYW